MHQHYHALLFHVQSQNSSINVAHYILCATKTTIETHEYFSTDLHNHLTKSNVDEMVSPNNQPVIKQLKVVLHIMKFMGLVITYV